MNSVQSDTKELQKEFSDIANRTSDLIRGIDAAFFRSRLINLDVRHRKQHKEFLIEVWPQISNASFEDVWFQLVMYWDFLNYTLLEHIVNNFGNEAVKKRMRDYKLKLKDFRCRTLLCDFAEYFHDINECLAEKDLKELVVKLDKDWQICTLQDIENWKESLTQKLLLPSFTVKPTELTTGCVSITWAIPTMFTISVVEKLETLDMTDFCSEHKIMSLIFNGVKYLGAPVLGNPDTSPITQLHKETGQLLCH